MYLHPCLHIKNKEDDSDLDRIFDTFIESHICNELCYYLKLPSLKSQYWDNLQRKVAEKYNICHSTSTETLPAEVYIYLYNYINLSFYIVYRIDQLNKYLNLSMPAIK